MFLAFVFLVGLIQNQERQNLPATGGGPVASVGGSAPGFQVPLSPALAVTGPASAPKIVSTPRTWAIPGQLYTYAVEVSGDSVVNYLLERAPDGMGIDPNSGLVSWKQPLAGRYEVAVQAGNSLGTDRQIFTLSVGESLASQCIPPQPAATAETATPSPTLVPDENTVLTYRVFQIDLAAESAGSKPYANGPPVSAIFTGKTGAAAGQQVTVNGFWDGGNSWKVRFAPTAPGEWIYQTSSPDRGLNGKSGRLTAIAPQAEQLASNPLLHGFLVPDGSAWKLSDGARFLPVGDTQWSFAEENTLPEWERWMDARQAQGFNSFLGTVWLALYDRPEATGPAFPGRDPKTNNLQVNYFQRLDRMVQYANDHGIQMGLSIGGFPGNSDWFDRFGSRERNDRWFKYVVARYAAYNVRWVLYGEANETNTPWRTTWQAEVLHSAQLVREADPYDHPIGSHSTGVDTSSAGSQYIDYIEAQVDRTETQYQEALDLRQYGKPVWFEEYWYESPEYDGDVLLGIRNTHRNFVGALAFPTMGSLMRSHYPDFDIDQVETDPGALRMCYFAKVYAGLDFNDFSPASTLVDRGQAGRFGEDLVVFLANGGTVTVDLTGLNRSFSVRILDINTGLTFPLGDVTGGGKRTIDSGTDQDIAVLLLKTE